MIRRLQAVPPAVAFAIGCLVVAASPAQPPAADPPKSTSDLRRPQEQNAKVYRELTRGLLALAQKLERSDRPEDRERAKTIRSALDVAEKANIDNQFQALVAGLGRGTGQATEVQKLIGQNTDLQKSLVEMLNVLMTDDESARLKAEIEKLEKFLKEAEEIKRKEEIIRAMTESARGDASKLAKQQADLADQTKKLGERMSGKQADGSKSNSKNAQPKAGDGQAEPKPDPKADPKNDAKPGEDTAEPKPDPAEAKGGEPKKGDGDPKGGEQKGGEPKAADPKGGDPKAGEPKGGEPKAGDPKSGEPKSAEPKAGQPKGADPKGGEPKAGHPKGGDPKSGEPKGGEPKAGEPKSAEKPGDPKGGEPKAGEPKPGEQAKGGEPKKTPKADAKPSQGQQQAGAAKNKPSAADQQQAQGKPSQGGQQGEDGQPGQPGQQGQQQQQAQQPEETPGRKKVQEAYPHQKAAEEDLQKNQRERAAKGEDEAIKKLEIAINELKKRLKQLREEETLKTLAALEARCQRMLALQIEVYEATKAIHAGVVKNQNQVTTADRQKSQQQADKENEIVAEADKALKLLSSEGSAVAFARVLEEVRGDMQAVQRRLFDARTEPETQAIEENIIAMLKDMVQALKKAQQDIQNGQGQQGQQQAKQNNPQKLIDLLAELRLIRAMQMQVNDRTKMYAGKYQGEQTADPIIQAELRQLAQRQAKLQDMVQKIATGANQ